MIMTSTSPTKSIPSIKDIFPQSQMQEHGRPPPAVDAPLQQGQASINQHHMDAAHARAESLPHPSASSASPDSSNSKSTDPPRKRSKISRACDACRRKKIKCNAEYSTTLSKVTQICNNCQKNGDECTFSRTPLKRGPSKGYSKEFEDREGQYEEAVDGQYIQAQPSAGSNGSVAQPQPINVYSTDHRQSQPPQQFPQNSLPFPQIRPNSQQMSTIKLPPIISYNQKTASPAIHKVMANEVSPSSPPVQQNAPQPNNNNNNNNNNSPPIQGPFWKVPYEMPRVSGPHRSSISSVTSGSGNRRRSSIDSVSSTSTTNSKLPILRNNSEFLSDSESEDFYSVRSSSSHRPPMMRTNSQSISPRNSVTSLSSLSGRVNKSMVLQGGPISPMTLSKAGTPYNAFAGQELARSNSQLQVPPPGGFNQSSPMDMLKADLDIYDKHFAVTYPVIPIEIEQLVSMIRTAGMEAPTENLVECFHIAINDLVNFKTVAEYTTISVFFKLQQFYQHSKVNRASTFLYAVTLVVLNYCLLLKGTHYSLGIASAASFLNDLNAVDQVFDQTDNSSDNRLAKLYLTLDIIDSIGSLKAGVQKTVAAGNLPLFVDKNKLTLNNFVYQLYTALSCLLKVRNGIITSNVENVGKLDTNDEFLTQFGNLIYHKYELFQIVGNLANSRPNLEMSLEVLTTTILNFANYLSTTTMSNKQILNPCLSLSIDQLFYTIKLVKIIVDNTSTEAPKLNSNLSISYNLLNLNLANLQLNEQTVRQIKQRIVDSPLDFSKAESNPDWVNAVSTMIRSDVISRSFLT